MEAQAAVLVVLAASQSGIQQRIQALLTVVSQVVQVPWVDIYVPQQDWLCCLSPLPSAAESQIAQWRSQVWTAGQIILTTEPPLVTAPPMLANGSQPATAAIQFFYGGFPVRGASHLIGVLSVLAATPVTLTTAQQQAVIVLAEQMGDLLASGTTAPDPPRRSPAIAPATQLFDKDIYQSVMRLSMSLQRCLSFEDLNNQLITHLPQELPLQAFELMAPMPNQGMQQLCLWPTAAVNVPCQDELTCVIPRDFTCEQSPRLASANGLPCASTVNPSQRSHPLSLWRCYQLKMQNRRVGLWKICLQPTAAAHFPDDSEILHNLADQIGVTLYRLILLRKLQAENLQDPLTRLFNRRHLMEVLSKLMKRVSYGDYQVGFIMLDLDHFKHFNDTYGHDAGDQVLRMMGLFLRGHARPNDVVCRFGGEEFALILPGLSWEILVRRANQLCRSTHYLNLKAGKTPLKITLSAGFAIAPLHAKTPSTLIKAADEALYAAKRQGRDRAVGATCAPQSATPHPGDRP